MLARFLGIGVEELFIKELNYRPFGEGLGYVLILLLTTFLNL